VKKMSANWLYILSMSSIHLLLVICHDLYIVEYAAMDLILCHVCNFKLKNLFLSWI
jgi:hypothetical protein